MSQCHVERGDRGGVRLIGCEPEADASARSCRACDGVARVRSSWTRRLVHVPVGQRSTHLLVRVRRYECRWCGRRWTDDLARAVPDGDVMTDAVAWRAVAEVVLRSKSVLACARDPACSWDMVNDAVLSRGWGTWSATNAGSTGHGCWAWTSTCGGTRPGAAGMWPWP